MYQIGTVIIPEPNMMDDEYVSRYEESIRATNQNRLAFMKENGVDITDVPTEEVWREFYNRYLKSRGKI